jgi:hypothetical protein
LNPAAFDVRPMAGSPLINAGVAATTSPAGHAFPRPLAVPQFQPPSHAVGAIGSAMARPVVAALDIGAFEFGSGTVVTDAGMTDVVVAPDVRLVDSAVVIDAGTAMDVAVPTDAGSVADASMPVDALRVDVAMSDARTTSDAAASDSRPVGDGAAGDAGPGGQRGSCGCRMVGTGAMSARGLAMMSVLLAGLATGRRRDRGAT